MSKAADSMNIPHWYNKIEFVHFFHNCTFPWVGVEKGMENFFRIVVSFEPCFLFFTELIFY